MLVDFGRPENPRNRNQLKVRILVKIAKFCVFGYGSEFFQNEGLLARHNVKELLNC